MFTTSPIRVVITLIALFIILAYTNPTINSYKEYIHNQILETTRNDDGLTSFIVPLFSGFASNLIVSGTIRKDFIIFSYYDTSLGNENIKVLGLLGDFYLVESSKAHRQSHSP